MGPDNLPPGVLLDKKQDVTTVKDMVDRIHTKIDDFADEVDEEFLEELDTQLKAKKRGDRGYFICKHYYWDIWLQKLFAQMISVKVWIIALITVLLKFALITNIQFASILGIIMAFKGSFAVAEIWKKNGDGSNDIINKV